MPTHFVEQTLADYRIGRDVVLNEALSISPLRSVLTSRGGLDDRWWPGVPATAFEVVETEPIVP